MKDRLREKFGIFMFEDLPQAIEQQHKKLYPVLQALRFAKENSDPQAEIVKSVRLKNGSLVRKTENHIIWKT